MLRAYSNNGVNFRTISQASDAQTGEVVLNWEPDLQVTEAQLEAAFPGRAAALAAQAKATANAALQAQMDALDGGGQARSVRAMLLAIGGGDATSLAKLQALEAQIAPLRAQLQS